MANTHYVNCPNCGWDNLTVDGEPCYICEQCKIELL
jgi:transposase-like protein